MKNALKHKGYVGRVEFDPEDCLFVGRIAGIEDSVGFHSHTAEGLVAAFREAVEDYLETCNKLGKKPDRPYSGTVYVRVDPATHAKVAIAAEMAGKSLNQFSADILRREAERLLPT
jgi:predicted HicB family RNase H-like nuclease